MSFWTHIVGVLHVDTFVEVPDIKSFVEDALKNAPKITGSERDASVFVLVPPGHNIYTDFDCNRCDFGDTVIHDEDGFCCDAPDGYQCPEGKYQSRAIIVVQGDLRDKMRAQTKREWNDFHRYISKTLKYSTRIATCRIDGY